MCALYAFMRIADDLSDETGEIAEKRLNLQLWRAGLQDALNGNYSHAIHPALHNIIEKYRIPEKYFLAAIDGVESDLTFTPFTTFAELRNYCYHVASVVGLCCIHIWGFSDDRALQFAEDAGIAFQLTNILRDLPEDAERGRVYLPKEDFVRFNYDPAQLNSAVLNDNYRQLVRFQVERARQYYQQSWDLIPLLKPAGRAVFITMAKTYRAILEKIEARNYDVFSERIGLSSWRKLSFALSAIPVRLGIQSTSNYR